MMLLAMIILEVYDRPLWMSGRYVTKSTGDCGYVSSDSSIGHVIKQIVRLVIEVTFVEGVITG